MWRTLRKDAIFNGLLALATLWLNPACAQSDPPFEGLRFNSFSGGTSAVIAPNNYGPASYKFKCNTNEVGARLELVINTAVLDDPENPGNYILVDMVPHIEGTNYWAVNTTNGTLGEFLVSPWCWVSNNVVLQTYTNGWDMTTPITPFLGKGNVPSRGMTGVAAELDLVIAGEPGSTNDVVVMFTVSATDTDTELAIPDEDISLGGG